MFVPIVPVPVGEEVLAPPEVAMEPGLEGCFDPAGWYDPDMMGGVLGEPEMMSWSGESVGGECEVDDEEEGDGSCCLQFCDFIWIILFLFGEKFFKIVLV